MNVFEFRDQLIDDYERFSRSFTQIHAEDIRDAVESACGGPPFAWDPNRRAWLRAEFDAYFAHLYGLTRAELSATSSTLPMSWVKIIPPRPSASKRLCNLIRPGFRRGGHTQSKFLCSHRGLAR
jgi:hypothetical protein